VAQSTDFEVGLSCAGGCFVRSAISTFAACGNSNSLGRACRKIKHVTYVFIFRYKGRKLLASYIAEFPELQKRENQNESEDGRA